MKLSEKQWKRVDVARRVVRRQLTVAEAAVILGVSVRQAQRICQAVGEQGVAAVVHGNSNRAPANKLEPKQRKQIVALRKEKYLGFNDQHFTEKLVEVEKVSVSRATVQRLLRSEGIKSPQRRRPKKHRKRRERKAQAGLMLQWDGSPHAWLEERGPSLCLMGALDDATGELLKGAHFVEQECAAAYLQLLLQIVEVHGIPHAIYMDRHGSLKRNDDYWTVEEELRGEQDPTHVGKALRLLDINPIYALSAQGKGRVERMWRTFQDRLVSELRLAGASTVAEANAVLEKFRPDFNQRFAVPPLETESAWRKPQKATDLVRVCSFYYESTVLNDNTIRFSGVTIDIPPGPKRRSYAQAVVEVRQLLDGSWRVYHRDTCIATQASTEAGELRAKPRRKRSAASRAFRRAVSNVTVSLP